MPSPNLPRLLFRRQLSLASAKTCFSFLSKTIVFFLFSTPSSLHIAFAHQSLHCARVTTTAPPTTMSPAAPLASLGTIVLLSVVTAFLSSLPSANSHSYRRCALFSTSWPSRRPHLLSHVRRRSIQTSPKPHLLLRAIPAVVASSCVPIRFLLLLVFLFGGNDGKGGGGSSEVRVR
ncbi:hypothetical protein PIB30_045324 [Stylosanthes scabra]|uniref:Uncharacterized protein n=1 Tax=Stylosanthes scabra TaxID=79078 RepID=A0ABU6XF71_9FABA|nr:hypothetical protein [Stylosanthes scabra]